MTSKPLTWLTASVLALTLSFGGCKSKPAAVAVRNQDGSITNPDGSVTYPSGSQQAQAAGQASQGIVPSSTGAVVNSDGSVTYPSSAAKPSSAVPTTTPAATPGSVAEAPVVRERASSETAPASVPKPVLRTVPAGARVVIRTNQTLKASTNEVGDRFTGTLAEAVLVKGGGVAFARGSNVEGRIVASKGRGRFKGSGALGIELTSIGGERVSTTEYEKEEKGRGKRTGALVGGGGGLGAIIGGLAGGGKGALIGGLAGAGAGTAGAAYTGNHDVTIPSESLVTFSLTAPLSIK